MKLYFIAGEASGDNLGGKLIHALKQRTQLEVYGVGGVEMEAQGLKSLFPMSDISLFGITEIIPHIPTILKRLKQTVEDIERLKPDAVITIDVPGFSFRVVEKLKARGSNIPRIHYVAPTVWAYKEHRAEWVAKWYDLLLLLLPFEPPYFDKVGVKNIFVGHPLIEDKTSNIATKNKGSLLMLPGSRRGELKRHFPIFEETIKKVNGIKEVVIPSLPHLKSEIIRATSHWSVPVKVITDKAERLLAFQTADIALVKSGTVALELALYNVPMVVTYKINPLTAWMLRRMVKVKYVNLVNLLLDRLAIPELLQEQCAPLPLADALNALLNDPVARAAQQQAMQEALLMLGLNQSPNPSEKAAAAILDFLKA